MSVLNERISFEKYNGTGNDFIVVDAAESVPDRPAFASKYCDRDTGVDADGAVRTGADGVLFLALEERYRPPRVVMTLVQPDGSVAAMCGNGARVAAAWAAERTGSDELMIDTPAGTRHALVEGERVTIEMGSPTFEPRDVPVDSDQPLVEADVEGLTVTAVNTGVPHAVAFVDDVDEVDLASVAPAVRHADVFPEGANVTVASRNDDGSFSQRTFERGVEGETRSCGTGAVAVLAAARRIGLADADEATVSPPGGALEITVPAEGVATLSGPAEHEFSGEADVEIASRR
jgi:diaminopimelate epimerase